MPRSVVSVLGDAGGAEALIPVLHELERRGELKAVFAGGPAAQLLEQAAIEFAMVPSDPVAVLTSLEPSVLMTGTSWGGWAPELAFIKAAEGLQIPSLAVIDFWANYLARFIAPTGELVMPDRVAVPDESARLEAIAEGIAGDRLVVTGNPHYEALLARYGGFDQGERIRFRERVGVPRKAMVVFFASQPIAALYGDRLGYTEDQILATVYTALEQVSEWLGHPILLAVRPHPRQGEVTLPGSTPRVPVRLAAGEPALAWAMSSELVTGMTSAVLMQAAMLGARVVSVQAGLDGPDHLPGNRLGITQSAYTVAEVAPALYRALATPAHLGSGRALQRMRATIEGATARVLDAIAGVGTGSLTEVK